MDQSVDNLIPNQSRHLRTRCQQRGVTNKELHAFLDAADRLVPVGRSCLALTLSRHATAAFQAEGIVVAGLERAQRRAVVIDGDGRPITIMVLTHRCGRRYRHGRTGRSWA